MISILAHHQECTQLLYCEAGKQDTGGFTALMHAVREGNVEAVRSLSKFEKGMANKNKDAALMIAAKEGKAAFIQYLLDEIEMRNGSGKTALDISILNSNWNCAK